MIRYEALVDYGKLRSAKVAIFIDCTDSAQAYNLLNAHGKRIEGLANTFSARILMAEQKRISAEILIENDLADAWLLLVSEGPSRGVCTKKNPQRINVDGKDDWDRYAFKEVVRQIKESTRIIEDVTGYYGRLDTTVREGRGISAGMSPN